ncbi:hypothetical protein M758_9G177300 [Ceratodon purpureus]|nr:hypothetical protein M758_9G177300 [Ceratodon purpureus]
MIQLWVFLMDNFVVFIFRFHVLVELHVDSHLLLQLPYNSRFIALIM